MLQDKLPVSMAHDIVLSFPLALASFSDLERHEGREQRLTRRASCEAAPCDWIGRSKELTSIYIEFVADRWVSAVVAGLESRTGVPRPGVPWPSSWLQSCTWLECLR